MVLQVLNDVTITIKDPPRAFVLGPGEILTLPAYLAVRVVLEDPRAFRIMNPTPLIPNVAVRWLLPDDTVQGPGTMQLVDGEPPNRRISVQIGEELRWIHERDIVEIDPWPAIDAKLDEGADHLEIDGPESPRLVEIQEYLLRHFDDRDCCE